MRGLRVLPAVLAVCAAAFFCTACSGNGNVPEAGKYNAVSLEVSDTVFPIGDFYDNGADLELKKNGRGQIRLGDVKSPLTWTLSEGTFSITCEGRTSTGTLSGGAAVVDDLLGTTMRMTFFKEGSEVSPGLRIVSPDGTLGAFRIAYAGAEQFELGEQAVEPESEGLDISAGLRIYYDFFNDSDGTTSASHEVRFAATQGGESLKYALAYDNPEVTYYNISGVRPGASSRSTYSFGYDPEGGPVTVEAYNWSGDVNHCVMTVFDPKALPGAPAEAWKPEPDPDPHYIDGLAAEGDLDGMYTRLLGTERFEKDGKNYIRVLAEVTNNTEESIACWNHFAFNVFQDKVELRSVTPEEMTEEDRNYGSNIPIGETRTVAYNALLFSDDPAEVEAEAYENGTVLGLRDGGN